MTMERPKILFIMHMPPPVHGASMVGKYIHDSSLVKESFDCYYINPTTAKNLEDVSKFRIGKIFDVFSLVKKVRNEVRRLRPDLVYFTANAAVVPFYKDFLLVEVLKHCGCKIVIHYHNKGVATRQDRWLDNFLYKRFFRDLKIILLAENLYKDVQKYVKREDCFVVPNGIPTTQILPHVRTNDSEPLNILYLSNMMEEKGVWTLLEACKGLKNRNIAFHCDFVGGWKDVTQDAFCEFVETNGLQDVVKAYGAKYGAEKDEFWNRADVFVFPTYYSKECFPLVLLEAMQQGVACISTNEAGIPGIIDKEVTGLIVEKRDVGALTCAIARLAEDRGLCRKMGQEGKLKFEREYTLDVFEKNMVETLSKLL